MQKTRKIDRAWNRLERRWQRARRKAEKHLQKTEKMLAIMRDATDKQRKNKEKLQEEIE